MLHSRTALYFASLLLPFGLHSACLAAPSSILRLDQSTATPRNYSVSASLFRDLESLARLVDIAYCVGPGNSGVHKPFTCASRCHEFPGFELIDTFCSGWKGGEACGFLVVDHAVGSDSIGLRDKTSEKTSLQTEGKRRGGGSPQEDTATDADDTLEADGSRAGRVLVIFRGTYSLANTIADLRSVKQDYVPYPGDEALSDQDEDLSESDTDLKEDVSVPPALLTKAKPVGKCTNCTVHSGFHDTYHGLRPLLLKYLTTLRFKYPSYSLHLVGHSLGGAIAALAGLEYDSFGWNPSVTTFGEPMIGNREFNAWLDSIFDLGYAKDEEGVNSDELHKDGGRYRRVTHRGDPVPLLPLKEWGYYPHAGEIFIGKEELQPDIKDVRLCHGDHDPACIASDDEESSAAFFRTEEFANLVRDAGAMVLQGASQEDVTEVETQMRRKWGHLLPKRFRLWQLFFAHRDYFWRLGLCVPGGDPGGSGNWGWGWDKYKWTGEEL